MKKSVKVDKVIDIQCSLCNEVENKWKNFSPDCEIYFNFGYGSKNDGMFGKTYYCSTCSDKILKVLEQNFPQVKFTPLETFS